MNKVKIDALEKKVSQDYSNIAGIVVLKDGKTRYEKYFNGCDATSTLHVYSVTKSIISALIGIALDKGLINSIEQKVLDFFPDYPIENNKTIRGITLKHLLTMTAPYKYGAEPYIDYFTSNDWLTFALNQLGGEGPIGEFRYAGLIGPDILSGILTKTAGQSVLGFAKENLFSPLEITVKDKIIFQSEEEQFAFNESNTISGWAADPTGLNTGGWGLTLTALDMAKIGQMYLNGGRWNNKQIISEKWIKESTAEHSCWKEPGLPYGYLWWIDEGSGYAAMGDGGNIIYINERRNLVAAITAFFKPDVTDRIEFIKKYVEPIFN